VLSVTIQTIHLKAEEERGKLEGKGKQSEHLRICTLSYEYQCSSFLQVLQILTSNHTTLSNCDDPKSQERYKGKMTCEKDVMLHLISLPQYAKSSFFLFLLSSRVYKYKFLDRPFQR
jgi:hypothetical protein